MNTADYIDEMKAIQEKILDYLDEILSYDDLKDIFKNLKIHNNRHEIKSVLSLIVKISNNFHRQPNFFNKIDQILKLIKSDIQKYFTNYEIFHFCKSNKRILLFFIEEQIVTIDENIAIELASDKYQKMNLQYFSPEILPFKNAIKNACSMLKSDNVNFEEEECLEDMNAYYEDNEDNFENDDSNSENYFELDILEKLPEHFYDKRKNGENDNYICKLIQENSVIDFIKHVNLYSISLNSNIQSSIYETNSFLLKNKRTSLIEYSVFFGSKEIFVYLMQNNVDLTPSLCKYAIHGKNAEIIHILEENGIHPDESYEEIFKESIKCHHNDIADYIVNQNLQEQNTNFTLINSLKYYNFYFMSESVADKQLMYYLCKYDHGFLVDVIANKEGLDINMDIIYIIIFWIQL